MQVELELVTERRRGVDVALHCETLCCRCIRLARTLHGGAQLVECGERRLDAA